MKASLRHVLVVALLGAVTAGGAAIPSAALTKSFRSCLAAARSEPANAACARAELARQEAALKRVWDGLRTSIQKGRDARHLALLDRAQTAWAAWRQAHCTFVAGRAIGGSSQVYWGSRCRARIAEDRILTLTRQQKAYRR